MTPRGTSKDCFSRNRAAHGLFFPSHLCTCGPLRHPEVEASGPPIPRAGARPSQSSTESPTSCAARSSPCRTKHFRHRLLWITRVQTFTLDTASPNDQPQLVLRQRWGCVKASAASLWIVPPARRFTTKSAAMARPTLPSRSPPDARAKLEPGSARARSSRRRRPRA